MSIKTDSMKAQAQYLHYDVPVQIEGTEGLMDVECGYMSTVLERLRKASTLLRIIAEGTATLGMVKTPIEYKSEAEEIDALVYRIENGCDGHDHAVSSTGGVECL